MKRFSCPAHKEKVLTTSHPDHELQSGNSLGYWNSRGNKPQILTTCAINVHMAPTDAIYTFRELVRKDSIFYYLEIAR